MTYKNFLIILLSSIIFIVLSYFFLRFFYKKKEEFFSIKYVLPYGMISAIYLFICRYYSQNKIIAFIVFCVVLLIIGKIWYGIEKEFDNKS